MSLEKVADSLEGLQDKFGIKKVPKLLNFQQNFGVESLQMQKSK